MEWEAAWTLAALYNGTPVLRDTEGAARTHDFDIELSDGQVIALEVTSSIVPEVVGMWKTVRQLDWWFDGLRPSWSVTLDAAHLGHSGTRIRKFHKRAPDLFRVVGAEVGRSAGDIFGKGAASYLSPAARQAIDELRSLGVRSANPVDTNVDGRGCIVVGTVGPGGWTDGRSVNLAVERAANANRTKLACAPADERHLFVWGRIQPVSTRSSVSFSDGVMYPRVSRGRLLRLCAIRPRSSAVCTERSLLFGMY